MIDLIANSDQQGVADTLASFLSDKLPVERHRRDGGRSRPHEFEYWKNLADLGCFALSLPEAQGGVGMSLAEETIAFREYGRALLSPSVLGGMLAVRIAAQAGLPELAELIAGKRRAAVANPIGARLGATISGELQLFDWQSGDLAVVWNESGMALLATETLCAPEKIRALDTTVGLSIVHLQDAKALAWIPVDQAALPITATVLIAAMLVGITESVRDMAVAYAQTRVQFGKPIGTYQAVKHRCVDIAVDAEVSWSQTVYAALTIEAGLPDAAFQVASAKLIANCAAIKGTRQNIQVHGGIGFTAELNAGLYLNRSQLLNELGGNVRTQQRRVLRLAGDALAA